ncbi:MAG: hypothetical protein J0I65_26460 [Variovorax sp.]|nr:hypothetical protein [Variovorax sp.]
MQARHDATMHMVTDMDSLARCRDLRDLEKVLIQTERLKYRGLLPCALRYAVWAVRQGGVIEIQDHGRLDASSPAFEFTFNNVRRCVARFCSRDTDLVDLAPGLIRLRRRSQILPPGWSAGIVFSGRDEEIPTLMNCIAGLERQPELRRDRGGEIVVCGPQRDLGFLKSHPAVRYFVHETPDAPQLMICQKKNALIRQLAGPRIAVLHARIVLDEDCLAAVPREFDMISPNTSVLERGRRVPYLSLGQTDAAHAGRMPRAMGRTMRVLRDGNPLRMHEHAPLFIDGGAFFVSRDLHVACPLDDAIAWQDAEDVDWCTRAFSQGFLIDLAPKAGALSATSKIRALPALGPMTWPIYRAHRWARDLRAGARHWALTLKGER